ncbi:MAG TPA: DUF2071 domain-containing protein [Thermoanaerobaculia bacterium]|nr:DUF2071 domain-containing protein [Thermoanaerobaculia bacterium]
MAHQHDTIDRLSPAREPDQQVVMFQDWHHLLFLHWEVPPAELQALVPAGLTVDLFEGKAYIGLIPFTLSGVRPVLLPALPGVSSFHEVNVRTYVHRNGRDPGVWFFSLDASSALAVEAARKAYELPYFKARIDFSASEAALPALDFVSHRDDPRGPSPAHAHIRYRPEEGPAQPAGPGTLEQFLVERYILYAEGSDHQLWRARVHHQPYPLQRVEVPQLDETLVWASGVRRPDAVPLRHYASGVNVKVYGPERVG